jgi:hypothetical protein
MYYCHSPLVATAEEGCILVLLHCDVESYYGQARVRGASASSSEPVECAITEWLMQVDASSTLHVVSWVPLLDFFSAYTYAGLDAAAVCMLTSILHLLYSKMPHSAAVFLVLVP